MQSVKEQLSHILRARGLHAALAFLNERTRFRYTGAYRFDPPHLRNISLFDRENPDVLTMDPLVLDDSYCGIVARSGERFVVEDSMHDVRLSGHPAQATMIAYHGYPLRDGTDRCFGSLCHWDVRPRLLPDGESQLLYDIAPIIARAIGRDHRRGTGATTETSLRT